MKMATVGMDLAKSVFQVQGVDDHGKVILRKKRSGKQKGTVKNRQRNVVEPVIRDQRERSTLPEYAIK